VGCQNVIRIETVGCPPDCHGYDFLIDNPGHLLHRQALSDHSVLSKARGRFGMEVFETFFNRSVELCRAAGLVRGEAAFLDSTLIQANAALASLQATDGHQPPMPTRRYVEQLFAENPVPEEPAPTSVADSSNKKPTGTGQMAGPKAQRPPLNRRARSRTDPEASVIHHPTFGLHLAYKAHVAVDDHPARVITAAVVTPGATSDEYLLEELLWRPTTVGRRWRLRHANARRYLSST
jgi:hypothetical protein